MKSNPQISVIIPVYNPGRHLYRCLDSIVNQTYRNLEIILVDDGSTDGSSNVCDDYQKKDERIKVKHIDNKGVSCARNIGLDMATGDYINFPDSDDYIDLDTYETVLNIIEKENVDGVCYEYYTTFPDKEIEHKASDGKYGVFDTEESVYEMLFSNRPFLCTKFFPIEAVKNLRFLENIYRGEDGIFCMNALNNIKNTAFIERPMYHYVQSEESACRGEFRPSQLSAIDGIPITERFLTKNYPSMIPRWRQGELHLMIMLYVDMAADKKDYKKEKKRVIKTYKKLWKQISINDVKSSGEKVKFLFFNFSPKLFYLVHKLRFKL